MSTSVLKFASIAEMTAMNSYVDKDVAFISGSTDFFVFDAASNDAHDGTTIVKPTSLLARKSGRWIRKKFKIEDLDGSDGVPSHASAHEDGGADAIDVTDLAGVLAEPQPPIIGAGADEAVAGDDARLTDARDPNDHEANHVSGGGDAFLDTDLLEAIVKRLQTSTGPTTLTVGAVADGEYLKRVGTDIVGASAGVASPYTAPVAAAFNALNSAVPADVETDLGDGVTVHGPAAGGTATAQMKGAGKAMNYSSGTITLVVGLLINQYAQDYNFAGVYFQEIGTGKLTTLALTAQTGVHGKINLSKWPSPTGGGAGDYFDQKYLAPTKIFFKLTYDGTVMQFFVSADMVTWLQVHTDVAKADYFTTAPDQWGFYINQQNATLAGDVTCFHFAVS